MVEVTLLNLRYGINLDSKQVFKSKDEVLHDTEDVKLILIFYLTYYLASKAVCCTQLDFRCLLI